MINDRKREGKTGGGGRGGAWVEKRGEHERKSKSREGEEGEEEK